MKDRNNDEYGFELAKFCYRIDMLISRLHNRYRYGSENEIKQKLFDRLVKKYSYYNDIELFDSKQHKTHMYARYSTAYRLFRLYYKDSDYYTNNLLFTKFVF